MIKYGKYADSVLDTMIKERTRKANERIKGLERTSSKELNSDIYKNANAYRWLERNVDKESGLKRTDSGGIRFSSATKKLTRQEKLKQLEMVDKFLNAKTSTVRGIEGAYRKAYKSFTSANPDITKNISYSEYINMMEANTLETFKKNFYSAFMRLIDETKSGEITPDISKKIIEDYYARDLKDINEAINKYKDVKANTENGFVPADDEIIKMFENEDD